MNKRVLSISMLVSGREETTEKSLASIQPLREILGAEVILVDTGCRPEFIEKNRPYADQILFFQWCDDFAKARNAGLEVATGEWFMFMDDDEWFEDVTPIIEFFQSEEYQEYHQAVYIARNYSNFEGTAYTDEWVSRMIYVEEDTQFSGRVHESLGPVRGKCKKINAFVHHYGYVFATEEERRKHFERNASILEALIKEEPDNLQWRLQIIKEYLSVRETVKLRKICEDTLYLISDVDKFFVNLCRGSFYLGILYADTYEEKTDNLWDHYAQFTEDKRNPLNVHCAMAGYVARALINKENKVEEFLQCGKTYMEKFVEWHSKEHSEQDEIIAENAVFIKDYMCENILVTDVKKHMDGNGDFFNFPNTIWTLAAEGYFPLEEMLLELPISQWMVQMMVLENQKYGEKWEQIGVNLARICTRSDIRYCYFDAVTENKKMKTIYTVKENVDHMDYETMTQVLMEFAQANLNYMEYIYTETAFEGDMDILSEQEKAAMWIASGLSTDVGQWREKLQCIGQAGKVYPKMGELIKKYMALLGERL